jgi:opacity protein-like surface antigen
MKHRLSLIAAAVLVATSATAEQRSGFYIGGDLGEADWGLGQKEAQEFSDIISSSIDFYAPFALVTPDKAKVEDTDFTYSLFIGYQFLPWLAVEATWMDLGQSTVKTGGTYDYQVIINPPVKNGGTYSSDADIDSSGWGLSVLPMLPIGESWDIFARLGYFWGDNNLDGRFKAQDDLNGVPVGPPYDVPNFHASDNNDVFWWGIGGQWTWDQRVSFRLEYSQLVDLLDTDGNSSSVDRYTLGIVYRFGE